MFSFFYFHIVIVSKLPGEILSRNHSCNLYACSEAPVPSKGPFSIVGKTVGFNLGEYLEDLNTRRNTKRKAF
jgi:hypothetical protein